MSTDAVSEIIARLHTAIDEHVGGTCDECNVMADAVTLISTQRNRINHLEKSRKQWQTKVKDAQVALR